jgi:hypothetical protein
MIIKGLTRHTLSFRLELEAGSLYSPSCLEEVFSETPMQPGASLCGWTGTKRVFESHRHRTVPQDIGVVDKDSNLVRA